jgi:hypothetical protein
MATTWTECGDETTLQFMNECKKVRKEKPKLIGSCHLYWTIMHHEISWQDKWKSRVSKNLKYLEGINSILLVERYMTRELIRLKTNVHDTPHAHHIIILGPPITRPRLPLPARHSTLIALARLRHHLCLQRPPSSTANLIPTTQWIRRGWGHAAAVTHTRPLGDKVSE